jgi:hypothetical protein
MVKTLLAFFVVACAMNADTLVVLPNGNAGTNGNSDTFVPLGETSEWIFQWQFSSSQLGSVPVGSSIDAIGFRLPSGESAPSSAVTLSTFDLELSPAARALGSLSTNEASNIGPGGVNVLSGRLTIPVGSFVAGSGPNPFYLINFTTPYTYTGGDLLFSLDTRSSVSFSVDANVVNSIGDTAGNPGGPGTTLRAEFYNYPITEIQFSAGVTSTPEPASVLALATVLILVGWRFRVSRG